MYGNTRGRLQNDAILKQTLADKQANLQTEADEDRDARLAGYKSPLRRLIDRLLPSKARDN
jgi:hypothetical protein